MRDLILTPAPPELIAIREHGFEQTWNIEFGVLNVLNGQATSAEARVTYETHRLSRKPVRLVATSRLPRRGATTFEKQDLLASFGQTISSNETTRTSTNDNVVIGSSLKRHVRKLHFRTQFYAYRNRWLGGRGGRGFRRGCATATACTTSSPVVVIGLARVRIRIGDTEKANY